MLVAALLIACFAAAFAQAHDFTSYLFNIGGANGEVQYCQTYPNLTGWVGPVPKSVEITADCREQWLFDCPVFEQLDLKTAFNSTEAGEHGIKWIYIPWTVDLPAGTNFSIRFNDTYGYSAGYGYVVPPKGPNPTCNQTLLHRAFEADSMGANYTGTRENQVKVSSAMGTVAGAGVWGAGAAVLGALGLVLV